MPTPLSPVLSLALLCVASLAVAAPDDLLRGFLNPPASARPWVYWYFMEGNITREGLTADLEAMRKAGLGGGIMLEVNIGVPKGPVRYMSPEWQALVGHAAREADRLGLGIKLGTGPGWCGTGGPWVKPDDAMQHLVASRTVVEGPLASVGVLPQPKPRTPFFGLDTLTSELRKQWEEFYRDEVVLAMLTPADGPSLRDLDEKALVYRAPFSSQAGVRPFLEGDAGLSGASVSSSKVVDLTSRLRPDGTLDWPVPPGRWTILRFGRTLTGQTSRPAPEAGLGFETDKFEKAGISAHLETFVNPLIRKGVTGLHFDSWEMGAQNWSPHFRALFRKKRGYDPLRYLPVMAGLIVDSADVSERFLWDLRQTAQELVIENHLGTIKRKARANGLGLSIEPYDMNPSSDLALGGAADEPMGEFWSKGYGFKTEYSCFEAASIGHTMGRRVIGAEAFTSDDRDAWLQHPASMKEQGDWALAAGINKFYFHRYQHQPSNDLPGMTMGPYGVHWERTQTWWDMVPAYHTYLSRCQQLLRQGLPVADILYLVPEGAPNVFQPPASAMIGELPDRRGYNFDGCAPDALLRAKTKDGRIVFPDGMSYRLLVLPRMETMTPRLLRKVCELVAEGATVVGNPPSRSPSLVGYPASDEEVRRLAGELWASGRFGKGRVFRDLAESQAPAPAPPLQKARWIWEASGDPAVAAPVGEKRFVKTFTIPEGRIVASAEISMTADNTVHLSINGKDALAAFDFHKIERREVAGLLKVGENRLEAIVANSGDAPNPAGLIGTLEIRFQDGGSLSIPTDDTWTVDGAAAKDLGEWTMAPWSLHVDVPVRPLYPKYEFTARILSSIGVAPDLESDDRLRYSHRRTKDADLYFVANGKDTRRTVECAFRTAGRVPELWDPASGRIVTPAVWRREGDRTLLPLTLDGTGSVFVVFRKPMRADADPIVRSEFRPEASAPRPLPDLRIVGARYGT
ncbi:hypothetical protein EON82_15370, partial [bacterium]